MELERFLQLRVVLQAFTLRDLQTTGNVLLWGDNNGFSTEEIIQGALLVPAIHTLEGFGYFSPVLPPESERKLREMIKQFPSEIRRVLRKFRWGLASVGPLQFDSTRK